MKLGCDPSRPDLHIGHSVVLQKLRDFQDLGHQAILVIGDFTAMIGDPSERNKTRPQLTLEEAKANAESYIEQSKVILDVKTLKVLFNSTWLNKMNFSDVINMSSKYTVARMIERDDFTKRFESEIPISMHEFLYPLAQAMDSVEIKSDVELGGTDQKFNLLVGRDLQREYDQEPQSIITLPLLEGTDGIEKMSKSYDNYIALDDSPQDMYGKLMSINDSMITKYYKLAVFVEKEKVLSDLKEYQEDDYIAWIGHATFLIKLGETTIITDPVFSKNAGPLIFGPDRFTKPALKLNEIPKVDLFLLRLRINSRAMFFPTFFYVF